MDNLGESILDKFIKLSKIELNFYRANFLFI